MLTKTIFSRLCRMSPMVQIEKCMNIYFVSGNRSEETYTTVFRVSIWQVWCRVQEESRIIECQVSIQVLDFSWNLYENIEHNI